MATAVQQFRTTEYTHARNETHFVGQQAHTNVVLGTGLLLPVENRNASQNIKYNKIHLLFMAF